MTDFVLKMRSNHSTYCAPWLVTTVDQKRDIGQILDTGPGHSRPKYKLVVLYVEGPQTLGWRKTILRDAGCTHLTSLLFSPLAFTVRYRA